MPIELMAHILSFLPLYDPLTKALSAEVSYLGESFYGPAFYRYGPLVLNKKRMTQVDWKVMPRSLARVVWVGSINKAHEDTLRHYSVTCLEFHHSLVPKPIPAKHVVFFMVEGNVGMWVPHVETMTLIQYPLRRFDGFKELKHLRVKRCGRPAWLRAHCPCPLTILPSGLRD